MSPQQAGARFHGAGLQIEGGDFCTLTLAPLGPMGPNRPVMYGTTLSMQQVVQYLLMSAAVPGHNSTSIAIKYL